MNTLVEFSNICKSFNNNILLDKVSFSLNRAEITTLIGQNGTGKTTIAKIILGLESFDSGRLFVKNGLRIGYVPQTLNISYNIPITAGKMLQLLAGNTPYTTDTVEQYLPNYAAIANQDLFALSGGQRQKLLLAGTIINKPDLMILDEPTQFLDVTNQQEFYSMLGQLKHEKGMTIFMISHDLFTVMKNSDQVICLNKHVCCTGKPTEMAHNLEFKNAMSEIGFYIHHHDHQH